MAQTRSKPKRMNDLIKWEIVEQIDEVRCQHLDFLNLQCKSNKPGIREKASNEETDKTLSSIEGEERGFY